MATELLEQLAEENPEAKLADGFEKALVGLARRYGQPTLAVYDYDQGVSILIRRDGMTYEEAVEYMEHNVVGAWVGEHTPIWLVFHVKHPEASHVKRPENMCHHGKVVAVEGCDDCEAEAEEATWD